jgi:squalene-hopene/tetraprenyl-beta-curcumene cyclase
MSCPPHGAPSAAEEEGGELDEKTSLGLGQKAVRTLEAQGGCRAAWDDRAQALAQAIERTRSWLLAQQRPDGHWCGELEGDTILESEFILLLAWLGREQTPLARKCAAYLLEKQLPEGGWAMYPGGRLEISGSVKAYFALKLTGHDPASAPLRKAREAILAAGGADVVNSFTRFYLALLGQIAYDHCPAVPPELVLLPRWSPINLYRMSAWSRAMVVPLSVMWACQPRRELPPELGIGELFLRPPEEWPPLRCPGLGEEGWLSWERFFRLADRVLKRLQRCSWQPLRRRALAAAGDWMIQRFTDSDGLGAIFPPIVWSLIALKCLGYREDSPLWCDQWRHLEKLILEERETARLQPCLSPVWDTAIALRALAVSQPPPTQAARSLAEGASAAELAGREPGLAADDPLWQAARWLLRREVTQAGDWATYVQAPPAGWYFEYRNEFYPDVDDTAMVLLALADLKRQRQAEALACQAEDWERVQRPPLVALPPGLVAACQRGRQWMLAMQNRDGGWGAFDRDNDAAFLCRVPFADHNAMIDPSTPDLAGRALEALAAWGQDPRSPAMARGVAYLRRTQEADGAWPGRWGVHYLYGTWQALVGLRAAGVPVDDPAIQRGAAFLMRHQQSCGGWGESPEAYEDSRLRGQGPVTASQTAWALLGLLAAGRQHERCVRRGIDYLLATQRPDGTWDEPQFTGTGFPRVFYLRYHYYPIYFPLLALATYRAALAPTVRSPGVVGAA